MEGGGLPVNISRTALVVMHAWDLGMPAEHPGEFRAVGELAASYEVGRTVFPGLLDAVRRSPLRLFHVVGGGKYYTEYPGYQFASDLAGPSPAPPEKIAGDEVHARIQQFRADFGRIGQHNAADVAAAPCPVADRVKWAGFAPCRGSFRPRRCSRDSGSRPRGRQRDPATDARRFDPPSGMAPTGS